MKLIALCLLFIAASSQTVFDPGCTPFGLRLSYGQYYTQQGGSTQIYVSFNTYVNDVRLRDTVQTATLGSETWPSTRTSVARPTS